MPFALTTRWVHGPSTRTAETSTSSGVTGSARSARSARWARWAGWAGWAGRAGGGGVGAVGWRAQVAVSLAVFIVRSGGRIFRSCDRPISARRPATSRNSTQTIRYDSQRGSPRATSPSANTTNRNGTEKRTIATAAAIIPPPTPARLTVVDSSALASSISARTSVETFSDARRTSSPTDGSGSGGTNVLTVAPPRRSWRESSRLGSGPVQRPTRTLPSACREVWSASDSVRGEKRARRRDRARDGGAGRGRGHGRRSAARAGARLARAGRAARRPAAGGAADRGQPGRGQPGRAAAADLRRRDRTGSAGAAQGA